MYRSKIDKIYLMMGNACNFKCRHCIQEDCKTINSNYSHNYNIDTKTIDYIDNIIESKKKKVMILFWGGEPLIYLDIIKYVVKYFGNKAKYCIITNGDLLNKDIVKYINKNDIQIVLSNDGENTNQIRSKNVLNNDDFINLFSTINNKSINSVIHGYNYNYEKLFDFIENKIGKISINTEFLRITWDMPKDIYNFDLEKYRKYIQKISELAYNDIVSGNNSNPVNVFLPILKIIATKSFNNTGYPNCQQVSRCLNLDLKGNIYVCHNSDIRIGTIKDSLEEINKKYKEWLYTSKKNECYLCDIHFLCNGGCPIEKKDNKIMCKIYKIFYNEALNLAKRLNEFTRNI